MPTIGNLHTRRKHIPSQKQGILKPFSFHSYSKALVFVLALLLPIAPLQLKAKTYYRSTGTGNWNTAATWETSSDSSSWDASSVPNATDAIVIIDGDVITLDANIDINKLYIVNGGTLNYSGVAAYSLVINEANGIVKIDGTSTLDGTTQNSGLYFQTANDQQLVVDGTITNLYRIYFENSNSALREW